jgi:hypothetical protein
MSFAETDMSRSMFTSQSVVPKREGSVPMNGTGSDSFTQRCVPCRFEPLSLAALIRALATAAALASTGCSAPPSEDIFAATSAVTVVGTWTRAPDFPFSGGVANATLLTDGTVLVSDGQTHWFKLTPDALGSYEHGTWTQVGNSVIPRSLNPSTMLRDGRYLIAGGEVTGGEVDNPNFAASIEIFDPLATDPTKAWTRGPDMPEHIDDTALSILPDGTVYSSSVFSSNAYTYDPVANSWTATGQIGTRGAGGEKGFLLMPNGKLLDDWSPGATYDPASHSWALTGAMPVSLNTDSSQCGCASEIGPAALLYSGQVLGVGATPVGQTGHTAIYDPPSNQWAPGPDMPPGVLIGDMGADVMPNGKVLLSSLSPDGVTPTTNLWEYDPNATSNPFTQVPLPSWSPNTHDARFLQLPTGQVLFLNESFPSIASLYNPAVPFVVAGAPTITSLSASTSLGALTLTGTSINGQTIGATYGDDYNAGTAYPLVYLQDSASHKYYARTFNFSTMAPAPGPGSCEVVLPSTLLDGTTPIPKGTYTVHLSASGVEAVAPLPTLTLGTQVVSLSGGETVLNANQSTMWTVTLDANAPRGGIVVDLSALKGLDAQGQRTVDIVTVQPTVSVPGRKNTATFTVTALQPGYAKIYATARTNRAQTVTRDFGTKLTSFTGPPLPTTGNMTPLDLNFTTPIPTNGMTVTFTSSDPTVATMATPVFLPGGTSSAREWVTLKPGSATIIASLPGSSISAPVGFQVTGLTGPTVPPSGNTATWTVTIDSSIASGQSPVTVNLSSDVPSRAAVPSSVQVTTGNSVSFQVTQGTDLNQATITASAPGSKRLATFGYAIVRATVDNTTISVSGAGGLPTTATTTLSFNASAPSQGLVLPVAAVVGGTLSNFVTFPPTVTLPAGASTLQVTATAASPAQGGWIQVGQPAILPEIALFSVVP